MAHTVAIDRMGSMHIWQGVQQPRQCGKYLYEPEADVYLQPQADVEAVLESLQADVVDSLMNGYYVFVWDSMILEAIA